MLKPDLPKKPAVFFDRDGTLMEERNYCSNPEDVSLIPGTREALLELSAAGFDLFIITNQAGIGRGYFTEADYQAVQAELLRQLEPVTIRATYFCPSHPDAGDPRRKPSPAMVLEAAADFPVDLTTSWFVGDRSSDIGCGRNAGLRTILVRTGYGANETGCDPDHVVEDAAAAACLILKSRTACDPAGKLHP